MLNTIRTGLGLAIALVAVSALASTVSDSEIDRMTTLIGDTAYGVQVHKVNGATAEEMVRNLADQNGSDPADFKVMATSDDLEFADQVGWGTIDATTARDLYSWMDEKFDANGDEIPGRNQDLENADAAILGLGEGGLEFGYTDGSSSCCGVSFMGLLIVDVKNGVIYEISLTDSGPC